MTKESSLPASQETVLMRRSWSGGGIAFLAWMMRLPRGDQKTVSMVQFASVTILTSQLFTDLRTVVEKALRRECWLWKVYQSGLPSMAARRWVKVTHDDNWK